MAFTLQFLGIMFAHAEALSRCLCGDGGSNAMPTQTEELKFRLQQVTKSERDQQEALDKSRNTNLHKKTMAKFYTDSPDDANKKYENNESKSNCHIF